MSTYAKLNALGAALLSMILLAAFFSMPVMAKAKVRKNVDDRCKVEVRSTGDARPTEDWAKSSVSKKWVKEVAARFGEAFTVEENAKDARERCYPAGFGNTRCEKIARPCEVRF